MLPLETVGQNFLISSKKSKIPEISSGWGRISFGFLLRSNINVKRRIWRSPLMPLGLSLSQKSWVHISGGSRIFLRGASTPKVGVQTYYFFKFFAENCMKMKVFGPEWRVHVIGAPYLPVLHTHPPDMHILPLERTWD